MSASGKLAPSVALHDEKTCTRPHPPGHPHCHYEEIAVPFRRSTPKLGRNARCFCGSEKKFKKCCLRGRQ